MADAFGYPFRRTVNYTGAYNTKYGSNSLPILEDMLFEAAPSGGGISGSLSVTLGNVTASAAGALAISGTASATFAAVTVAAGGTLPISGTASVTLGDVLASAAGEISGTSISGSLDATLDDVTLSSLGSVEVQQVQVSRGAASRMDRNRREFEANQDEWRNQLRDIIESVFEEAAPPPDAPMPVEVRREVARNALPLAELAGIQTSLTELMKLVQQYEAQRQQDDDDELFMLMAA